VLRIEHEIAQAILQNLRMRARLVDRQTTNAPAYQLNYAHEPSVVSPLK